jgi:hypothetical protein
MRYWSELNADVPSVTSTSSPPGRSTSSGIDLDGDPRAAESTHQLGGLLDGLGAVVVRADRGGAGRAAAAGADDRCPRLAEGCRDTAPGTAGRPGHDRHSAAERPTVR